MSDTNPKILKRYTKKIEYHISYFQIFFVMVIGVYILYIYLNDIIQEEMNKIYFHYLRNFL